jgi:hypothetical protein
MRDSSADGAGSQMTLRPFLPRQVAFSHYQHHLVILQIFLRAEPVSQGFQQ